MYDAPMVLVKTANDLNQPPERNCPGGFSLYGLFHDAALMALKSLFFNELYKPLSLKNQGGDVALIACSISR